MEISPSTIWLIVGALLLIFEFALAPAIGFLFIGIGAIITGFLITFGLLDDHTWQWIAFAAATIISAVILWKPMKNWRSAKHNINFSDISGDEVEMISDLKEDKTGKAKWQGTTMKAKLAEGAKALKAGDKAEIVEVQGIILFVR